MCDCLEIFFLRGQLYTAKKPKSQDYHPDVTIKILSQVLKKKMNEYLKN